MLDELFGTFRVARQRSLQSLAGVTTRPMWRGHRRQGRGNAVTRSVSKQSAGDDRKRTGGGAATSAGTNFQEDVAGWLAVQILAEAAVPTSFGLPAGARIEHFLAETFDPVDDLRAGTSEGGEVFIQSKTTLSLSDKDEALASVVDQFVRQMAAGVRRVGSAPRPMTPELDRLVLVVSTRAPSTITEHLAKGFDALRSAAETALGGEVETNRNKQQADAVGIIRSRFERAWQALHGRKPSQDEWGHFVRLVRIRPMDLSEDGADRREAEAFLRNHILADPSTAAAARAVIVDVVRQFGPRRSGGDRRFLREQLIAAGLSLKGLRSAESDIAEVQKYSRERLALLQRLAEIEYRGTRVKIDRSAVTELARMAEEGDLVVIGEPGAGKSGCMHDFAERVMDGGRGCVLLEAEHLHADSAATLAHGLGIPRGTLVDVLEAWPLDAGPTGVPARRYLVIDALDAARGSCSLASIIDLVRQVRERAPHWRVLASIREFDLKHSASVQDYFAGAPHPELRSDAFAGVRHLQVRRLTPEELASAQAQCPPLRDVLTPQNQGLRDLATNPFNLSLLIQLVDMSVSAADFASVRVRTDLLDLYWRKRVERHDATGAMESAARAVVEVMKNTRDLGADRSDVTTAPGSTVEGLTGLLRQGVIRAEPRRSGLGVTERLSFAHNILFDYAVARLWLRDLPQEVIAELESPAGQDLVLFARPSLLLTFESLWHLAPRSAPSAVPDRKEFWDRALAIAGSELRLVGKIIAAGVAASEYRHLSDIEYVLTRLDPEGSGPAARLVRYVVTGSVTRFSKASAVTRCFGLGAPEWLALAGALLARAGRSMAWHARVLLAQIERDDDADLTPDQREWANHAARALLEIEFARGARGQGIVTALAVACRTIPVDPAGTLRAIRPVLNSGHSENWHELLRPLAEHLQEIASASPPFAARLIHSAFSKEFSYEDQEPPRDRLLPLTFNKRDLMDMVRRALAESAVSMLNAPTGPGTHLAIILIETATKLLHGRNRDGERHVEFALRGRTVHITPDYSSIWGDRPYTQHEAWTSVLAKLEDKLKHAAAPGTGGSASSAELGQLLDAFAKRARTTLIWNAVLECAARAPSTLGVEVSEMLASREVLSDLDTRDSAAALIPLVWPHLDEPRRAAIEGAIMAVGVREDPDLAELWARTRDALLGCIPTGQSVTPEATARLTILANQGGAPARPPSDRGVTVESISHEEMLRIRGVNVDSAPTKAVRELKAQLESAKPATGEDFSAAEVGTLLPRVTTLLGMLKDADQQGVHQEIVHSAEAVAYSTAERMARAKDLDPSDPTYRSLKALLLEMTQDSRPVPESEEGDRSGNAIGWSGGQPRIEAAEGLMHLARNAKDPDVEVLEAVRRLASDPHWAVRFQVYTRVNSLWDADRALMWALIEQGARDENDRGVLRHFCHTLVAALLGADADRIDRLVTTICDRLGDEGEDDSVVSSLAFLLTWRTVRQDHESSRKRIAVWAADPVGASRPLWKVIAECRGLLVLDSPRDGLDFGRRVRGWAFDTLSAVTNRILELFAEITSRNSQRQFDKWTEEDAAALRTLFRLADHVTNQVFFASGAFNEKRSGNRGEPEDSARSPEQIKRFFDEGRRLLEGLCDVPFVNAAHDVLKTLEFLVPLAPGTVFTLVHRCLKASQTDSIQHEFMAADLVVKIVEGYLAEHRDLFRRNADLRAKLMDVLDIFVEVGWPQAIRLTFRLDEVFR